MSDYAEQIPDQEKVEALIRAWVDLWGRSSLYIHGDIAVLELVVIDKCELFGEELCDVVI